MQFNRDTGVLTKTMSHDSLIFSRIANQKKRIMVGFGLFLGKFERITNSKSEIVSELCYTVLKLSHDSCTSVKCVQDIFLSLLILLVLHCHGMCLVAVGSFLSFLKRSFNNWYNISRALQMGISCCIS